MKTLFVSFATVFILLSTLSFDVSAAITCNDSECSYGNCQTCAYCKTNDYRVYNDQKNWCSNSTGSNCGNGSKLQNCAVDHTSGSSCSNTDCTRVCASSTTYKRTCTRSCTREHSGCPTQTCTGPQTATIACPADKPYCVTINNAAACDARPIGYHDASACNNNWGWACDANDYNQPLTIHFYKEPGSSGGSNSFLGSTTADAIRNDVKSCGGTTNHGFNFTPPSSVLDGNSHDIYAYAINLQSGGQNPRLTNSPKTITCPRYPITGMTGSCSADGTTGAISWNVSAGASSYLVRIDDQTANGWNGSCNPSTNPGDYCFDGYTSTSYNNFSTTSNNTYHWWIHSCGQSGCGPAADGGTIYCSPGSQTHALSITKSGTGTGRVTSSPTGIDCGSTCNHDYSHPAGSPTNVTLTSTPDSGSTFAGWSGDLDCTDGSVTMSTDKTCTATFNLIPVNPFPWIKLKNTSFYGIGSFSQTIPASPLIAYDAEDDATKRDFIIGTGTDPEVGTALANPLNSSPVSSKGWWANSSKITHIGADTFIDYVKGRKIYIPVDIANLSSALQSGKINLIKGFTGSLTISDSPTAGNNLNKSAITACNTSIVLLVEGAVNIQSNFNVPTPPCTIPASVAILSTISVTFDPAVTTANGIFIAPNLYTGAGSAGLKIKGNLISTYAPLTNNRSLLDNRRPSLFIVSDPKPYLDLLPLLSTTNYSYNQLK